MLKKRKGIRLNNKKLMYSMLAFVLIGIATMTIAYATLSTTLKITGSAEFEDASWSLILEEHTIPDSAGVPDEIKDGNVIFYDGSMLKKKPTLLGTSISDFQVSLSKIGSHLYQYYQLTNTGEVPARLESIVYSEPEIDSDNEEDIELVQENFVFYSSMYYCYLENGELFCGSSVFDEDDIICPGATIGLSIMTGYNPQAPRVPYNAMTISNLSVDFNFVATDQNLCNGSVPVTSNTEND